MSRTVPPARNVGSRSAAVSSRSASERSGNGMRDSAAILHYLEANYRDAPSLTPASRDEILSAEAILANVAPDIRRAQWSVEPEIRKPMGERDLARIAAAREALIASLGRLSPGEASSNSQSTRSAQSAAHAATSRRSASLSVWDDPAMRGQYHAAHGIEKSWP